MSNSPLLIIPYMWIGDFVRCHTVVKLLKQRLPTAAIDVLTTSMVAPLLDYMPGVRKGIVANLPRRRLAWKEHHALAHRSEKGPSRQSAAARTELSGTRDERPQM